LKRPASPSRRPGTDASYWWTARFSLKEDRNDPKLKKGGYRLYSRKKNPNLECDET
jgi:hypothetical protein